MEVPSSPNPKRATEVAPSIRTAMRLLREAFVYSQDVELSRWEFAVEIQRLRDAGVTDSELRWLLCKGYVEHADEVTSPCQKGRSFHRKGNLALSDATCFVSTDDGIHFERQIGSAPATTVRQDRTQAPGKANSQSESLEEVVWDPDRRELCVGGKVVKQYHVPAANQELILSAFQEEGWPARIDDPLPPVAGSNPKQRLHAAINCLNRNQKNNLIRFRGDGNGSGVCWEIARQWYSSAE